MQWDHEVDIVSVGSGAGALATAIVAVDGGQTVFVAQSAGPGRRCRSRFGIDVSDGETNAYLDAVTEVVETAGFGTAMPDSPEPDLPVRVVADAVPVSLGCHGRRDMVEPFVGARLSGWAADCATAGHGVLYTRVTSRDMTTMRSSSGEKFEAAVVGSVDRCGGGSVIEWLSAQARGRGIDVWDGSLERLVFDDGQVVGAVVATPDGACAVSARRGVVLAAGGGAADRLPGQAPVRVSVVSKTASRFGRVELLAAEFAGSRLAGWTVQRSAPDRRLRSRRLTSRARCSSISGGQLRDGSL
jgi:FAD binding domain